MFRVFVAAYGVVLGLASLWMLLAELSTPGFTALPQSADAAGKAASRRAEALWAARIGGVRGDLWSDAAYTYSDLIWANRTDPQALSDAEASATRAASLMPTNSAVWLLLGALASRYGNQVADPTEALKMSYYTGPREDALIPIRLRTAATLNVAADPELERLFRREVETALTDRTSFKPALVSAYSVATSSARDIIDDTVKRLDPTTAQVLRPGINR